MSAAEPDRNGGAGVGRPQLRQPRLADMVASILRERIIDGVLEDGALLPKQDELIEEFRISRPSLREALRILETEGLLTVRRGNVGGAVVQVPTPDSSAYMFGLVLQSWQVQLSDLADAIRLIEPVTASLCAGRGDRETEVVPQLQGNIDECQAAIKDGVLFTRLARQFHEELVAACGNRTLILMVGALETLWSEQERQWAQHAQQKGVYPDEGHRREVLAAHKSLLRAVVRGDADKAARLARVHLQESQRYALAGGTNTVRATALRNAFNRPST